MTALTNNSFFDMFSAIRDSILNPIMNTTELFTIMIDAGLQTTPNTAVANHNWLSPDFSRLVRDREIETDIASTAFIMTLTALHQYGNGYVIDSDRERFGAHFCDYILTFSPEIAPNFDDETGMSFIIRTTPDKTKMEECYFGKKGSRPLPVFYSGKTKEVVDWVIKQGFDHNIRPFHPTNRSYDCIEFKNKADAALFKFMWLM